MPPREMIGNSWKWARANGKIRVHPVHGKEEARLVLTDWFEDKKERGEERSTRGNATVQDHNDILASFLPYSLLCLDHLGPPASRLQPLPQDEGEVLMDDDVQPALDPPLDPEQAQEIAKAAAAHSGGKGKLLAMYMGISCFFSQWVIFRIHVPIILRTSAHNHHQDPNKPAPVSHVVLCLHCNPRLMFPALQRNESPFALIPTWLQVLGKKIDGASGIQDRKSCFWHNRRA